MNRYIYSVLTISYEYHVYYSHSLGLHPETCKLIIQVNLFANRKYLKPQWTLKYAIT